MSGLAARLQLAALVLFAAYQALGVFQAMHPHEASVEDVPDPVLGLVIWKMFAPFDPTNWRVDFEGADGEQWRLLPMEQWVPVTPDRTLLWEKGLILRRPTFRVPFLREACRGSGARRVRAVWRSWPKVPGQPVDSAAVTREKVLVTWTCE